MRIRTVPAVVPVVLVALAAAGCTTGDSGSFDPGDDTSVYDDARATESFDPDFAEDYEQQASLPDGRKIRLWYSESGDRLLEQHYSPDEDAWTTPQVVVRSTEPHPCQGIDIVEEDGVVAVIADFGIWCYDGEPPEQSVAAVTTGDLTEWAVDVTDGFDGWSRVTVAEQRVEWQGPGRSLAWTPGDGFARETGDATG